MRKVKITADLEIHSELGTITIQNKDQNLSIDVSSSSAVIYPLSVYLGFRRYLSLTKKINQPIIVMISRQEIIKINEGQINYLKKWWLFKFLVKAIVREGL